MLEENDRISSKISELAAVACSELFRAHGVELERLEGADEAASPSDAPALSGVIGFVGSRLRGTCLLVSGVGPVQASCPDGGRPRDWVGELTNQLVGRLKAKLIARGVEVFVTTPIVMTGTSIRPVPRGPLCPTKFSSSEGFVFVWVEAEAGSDLVLGASDFAQPSATIEGDILIF